MKNSDVHLDQIVYKCNMKSPPDSRCHAEGDYHPASTQPDPL